MALYISEIALFHKDFVSKRSSDMARASLALARCILNRTQPRHNEWAAQYDALTLVTLSQQLHHPSQVLSRKYASAHLSRVSTLLEDFLAQQASIARCYAAPPTPPAEVPLANSNKVVPMNSVHLTPQKGQYQPNMPLTPPITPDIEYFGGYNASLGVRHTPATPTPLGGQQSTHRSQQYGTCYPQSSME